LGYHSYCGNTMPHVYYSSSSKLRIYFVSDSENEREGFNLTVRTVNACTRNFTALQGRYSSGNNPQSCKTTITVPVDYTISLYFYRFFMVMNDCEKSSMKIYDGSFDNGALLQTLCGYTVPDPIFSTGNQLSIVTKYHNDTSWHSRGNFDILYVASKKSKGPGCGGDIYNYGGYFTSPLYPNNNRTNFDCTWNVTVPQNLIVAVKFASE
jgi:cubilin